MSQQFRLEREGLINREKKISFNFNGSEFFGYEGDTLAQPYLQMAFI
jgi:sarcosine oxidase subunit alpha